jgi:hypothetical protein
MVSPDQQLEQFAEWRIHTSPKLPVTTGRRGSKADNQDNNVVAPYLPFTV